MARQRSLLRSKKKKVNKKRYSIPHYTIFSFNRVISLMLMDNTEVLTMP
jgi:hypothetical protein